MSAHEIPDALLQAAIDWAVRLQSGAATEADRTAFAVWLVADPDHADAWQLLQKVDQVFSGLPPQVAHRTLDAASRQRIGRRRAIKIAVLSALGAGTLGALGLSQPWQTTTQYASAIGQRRKLVLEDGTLLVLNTNTHAAVTITPWRREITLLHGEIHVDTGADARAWTGHRPFYVQAGAVRLQALGTSFAVYQSPQGVRLHVTEGAVAIIGTAAIGRPGETWMVHGGVPHLQVEPALDASAWAQGALVAHAMPLADFVRELARYTEQRLDCDPAAAHLRVSGVFQLDDKNPVPRALKTLSRGWPLRIEQTADGGLRLVPRPH
ncbi:DUF4880 domain-containing protein [Duganella sp. FT135W]|uniref:DUF4880 domain-containing protein n=1 Tax=Duganella flavida TaxID=2692175 RepID=A0A6L8KBS4_9BURK|nr:FecR domain-containing protein [Duganella flavida]MYM24923.1 DUF4880 domain-containing protein [Duganella flavida]